MLLFFSILVFCSFASAVVDEYRFSISFRITEKLHFVNKLITYLSVRTLGGRLLLHNARCLGCRNLSVPLCACLSAIGVLCDKAKGSSRAILIKETSLQTFFLTDVLQL